MAKGTARPRFPGGSMWLAWPLCWAATVHGLEWPGHSHCGSPNTPLFHQRPQLPDSGDHGRSCSWEFLCSTKEKKKETTGGRQGSG